MQWLPWFVSMQQCSSPMCWMSGLSVSAWDGGAGREGGLAVSDPAAYRETWSQLVNCVKKHETLSFLLGKEKCASCQALKLSCPRCLIRKQWGFWLKKTPPSHLERKRFDTKQRSLPLSVKARGQNQTSADNFFLYIQIFRLILELRGGFLVSTLLILVSHKAEGPQWMLIWRATKTCEDEHCTCDSLMVQALDDLRSLWLVVALNQVKKGTLEWKYIYVFILSLCRTINLSLHVYIICSHTPLCCFAKNYIMLGYRKAAYFCLYPHKANFTLGGHST